MTWHRDLPKMGLVAVLGSLLWTSAVAAQTVFAVCQEPAVGLIYLVDAADGCLDPGHGPIAWPGEGSPADGSVTTAKLVDDAVTSAKILDGTIATADVGDGAITQAKLDAGVSFPLAAGDVTTTEILDGTIATADVADGAITQAKLDAGIITGVADGSVTTAKLADGAVTAAKLAVDAVTSASIATDAVGSSEIAANAVGSGEIATGAVTTNEIADGTISAADLAGGAVEGLMASSVDDLSDLTTHEDRTSIGGATVTLVTASGPGTLLGGLVIGCCFRASSSSSPGVTGTVSINIDGNGAIEWPSATTDGRFYSDETDRTDAALLPPISYQTSLVISYQQTCTGCSGVRGFAMTKAR